MRTKEGITLSRKKGGVLSILLFPFLWPLFVIGQVDQVPEAFYRKVKKGNRAFAEQRYERAGDLYHRALSLYWDPYIVDKLRKAEKRLQKQKQEQEKGKEALDRLEKSDPERVGGRGKTEDALRSYADSVTFKRRRKAFFRNDRDLRELVLDTAHSYVVAFQAKQKEEKGNGEERIRLLHQKGPKGMGPAIFHKAFRGKKKAHRPIGRGNDIQLGPPLTSKSIEESKKYVWTRNDGSESASADTLSYKKLALNHELECFFDHASGDFQIKSVQTVLEGRQVHYTSNGDEVFSSDPLMTFPLEAPYDSLSSEHPLRKKDACNWGIKGSILMNYWREVEQNGALHDSRKLPDKKNLPYDNRGAFSDLGAETAPLNEFLKANRKGAISLYRTPKCQKAFSPEQLNHLEDDGPAYLLLQGAIYYDEVDERFHVWIGKIGAIGTKTLNGHFTGYEDLFWIDADASTEE